MTDPARAPNAAPGITLDLATQVEQWCRLALAPRRRLTLAAAEAVLRDALRPRPHQPELVTVKFGRVTHLMVAGTDTTRCGQLLPALIATTPGARVGCAGCALPPEAD